MPASTLVLSVSETVTTDPMASADHAPLVDRFDVRSVPELLLSRNGDRVASHEDAVLDTDAVLVFVAKPI